MSIASIPLPDAERALEACTGTHSTRAKALRVEIESLLGERFPAALTPAPCEIRETTPTGIDALDAMLGGGLPIGAITELYGPLSSGRTGVAQSVVAAAMREGSMCVWVDASDAFDPESAAANGVCLEQLLWVRCGVQPSRNTGASEAASTSQSVQSRMQSAESRGQTLARAGQHPRDEVRGLDTAVGQLLREAVPGRRDRSIGTPGAPNRNLSSSDVLPADGKGTRQAAAQAQPAQSSRSFRPVPREEQVSSDRQPRRGRGADAPAGQTNQASAVADVGQARGTGQSRAALGRGAGNSRWAGRPSAKPWSRLDQALRAADLLLQAGGFRVLVLDLGSIAPEHALRIPLATWFRFRAAADANRTVLLLLTQTSCARSSAGLVVHFSALEAQTAAIGLPASQVSKTLHLVEPDPGTISPGGAAPGRYAAKLIESIRYHAQPLRQRFATDAQPVAINQSGARRPPRATWQLSAYPAREQA